MKPLPHHNTKSLFFSKKFRRPPALQNSHSRERYWKAHLKVIAILLVLWFLVSYGCGILWVDFLDQFRIGGFKLGFWFAQQGSIYTFVILIFAYYFIMQRIDKKYDVHEK